ncbi:hypothetical protein FOMPIDRAFT_1055806 [Fomitopsis schrenkii]|uniref:Uncharacterized protein n=1 Tax=Fomitopsis schrenkii TaxID=2126942 RepID=S8DLR8_FOMSC|nr:hypothetical protein FOMPIDRAFT_1055806 [Fomitopsis schrenkii]
MHSESLENEKLFSALQMLRPELQLSDIPSSLSAWSVASEQLASYMEKLATVLGQSQGEISFTSNYWMDQAHNTFLSMTGHWINAGTESTTIKMNSAVLCLRPVADPQTAAGLAQVAFFVLDMLKVTDRIGRFTVSGLQQNLEMLQGLKRQLAAKSLAPKFKVSRKQVHCLEDVVRLSSHPILRVFKAVGKGPRTLAEIPPEAQVFCRS